MLSNQQSPPRRNGGKLHHRTCLMLGVLAVRRHRARESLLELSVLGPLLRLVAHRSHGSLNRASRL